ncbi:MAG: hypothetical protein SFV20_09450 [Sphingopyxis sp.]|nr:hypothetical protein [Sphingopyxis sp.]
METIYDWVTVAMFAGLIVLFLHRSAADEPVDTIWHYLPPSICCAAANYFGNEGNVAIAVALMVAVGIYVVSVLNVQLPSKK